jgi:hypothetical protein
MLAAMTTLLMTLTVAAPADVKGKWDGTVSAPRSDGTTAEDTVLMILDQKDTAVSGTLGGSESDQHPITSGSIDGNKVTIVATHVNNGREYRLELMLDGDQLKGTVAMGERKGEVHVKRRKE